MGQNWCKKQYRIDVVTVGLARLEPNCGFQILCFHLNGAETKILCFDQNEAETKILDQHQNEADTKILC